MVDGLLSRRETWAIAAIAYALGAAIGLVIVAWRAPAVLPLGVIGIGLAFTYHAPPLKPLLSFLVYALTAGAGLLLWR